MKLYALPIIENPTFYFFSLSCIKLRPVYKSHLSTKKYKTSAIQNKNKSNKFGFNNNKCYKFYNNMTNNFLKSPGDGQVNSETVKITILN